MYIYIYIYIYIGLYAGTAYVFLREIIWSAIRIDTKIKAKIKSNKTFNTPSVASESDAE